MATTRTDPATLDGTGGRDDGWSATPNDDGRERKSRLRLLYHSDLSRLGAVSLRATVADSEWLTIGRGAPFFAPLGSHEPSDSLDDPQVSRKQLHIRWCADIQRFEVDTVASAKRPLFEVSLDPSQPATVSRITGPTLLAPGSCVAIGDRVLLGLELGDTRGPRVDRMGLVGESDVVWALRDEVRSVAQFGRPALVIGPTGAGKELVARALHLHGPRSSRPFVAVNCAALPEKLVESTLFGHKRGAFTGADTDEPGLFRAADGGILFLDELGELPLAIQPKLLRVLQDGVVAPVGAHDGRRVDVRVVAATNRDLDALVRAGALREDLYHRLSTHVLRVPPLADRRFDIPELFVHMLRRLRVDHPSLDWLWSRGREWQQAVPIAFMADLLRRGFQGNVRELENYVERTARQNLTPGAFRAPDPPSLASASFVLPSGSIIPPAPDARGSLEEPRVPEAILRAAGETLGLAHKTVLKLLPPALLVALSAEAQQRQSSVAEQTATLRARASQSLVTLLEAHDYNQSGLASALGTSRTTLIKLMDDLHVPRATDLTPDAIALARSQTGDDLAAAARLLGVSSGALKRRLAILDRKPGV